MKKQKNKQGKKASREMKAKNYVNVQNADGCLSTVAKVVCRNKINFLPKISVIIPVFNAEHYLRTCLDSIINQSLREIEIICVDDGSKDKSLSILKEYASKDDRICVLSQKNLYAGVARNAGIAVARGEYLSFLDSDDFFELDMLQKIYDRAKKDNSDMVVFGNFVYDHKTKKDIKKTIINKKYTQQSFINPLEYKNSIFTSCNPNPWNKITKREIFTENNLRFEGFSSCNDMTCACTLFALVKNISFMEECFVHYRTNTDTNISATRTDKIENFLYAADKLEQNLKKINMLDVFYYAFVERVSKSLYWETKSLTKEQKENVKQKAQNILTNKLYNELFGIKISVIIPVYNTQMYIHQCLDSIINQSLKEIEIICVDDGSKDNSLNILREYEKKDNRIIVLTQKNQRQGAARNNALKIARGKYVQFVDSDDYISLDACEKLYNKCEDLQLDMLSFAGINFENETGKTMVSSYYNFKWLPAKLDKDILYCNWRKYMPYMAVSAALTIYNKNFIKSHDITFPERIYFEDNLFFVKAILNAQKFSILKEILYFRRVHKESTTQNLDKNYADFLIISDMVLSYVKIHNKQMLDRYIKQYLMLCIRGYDKLSPEIKISQEKNLRKLLLRYNYSDYNIQYPKSVKSICLKLLHLPFYLYCMYKRLVNLYRRLIANEKVLHTFRIDMKNYGTRNNSIEIRAKDVLVTKTKWNTDEKGIGIMIQGHLMRQNIHIKIIGNGVLKFSFRGPDKRCNGKRYPVYIDYKSIKIDDKELLSMPITTWHDKAFAYEMNVTDGQEILLSIEQIYHNYSSNELKDMVTKLNFADKN